MTEWHQSPWEKESILNTEVKKKDKMKFYITWWLNDFNMKKGKF